MALYYSNLQDRAPPQGDTDAPAARIDTTALQLACSMRARSPLTMARLMGSLGSRRRMRQRLP